MRKVKRKDRHGIGGNNPPPEKKKKKAVPLSYDVGDAIPENLGIVADHLKEVEALRLEMTKQTAEVKERETELRNHLIDNLAVDDDDNTGASGLKYRAQIVTSEKASVTDWELTYDYIAEHDRFDLMGKSLNQKAVDTIWEKGKKLPGVEKVIVKKVSITKL
jgi:hypothetical protein